MTRLALFIPLVVLAACGPMEERLPAAQVAAEMTRALCEVYVRCGAARTVDGCQAQPEVRDLFGVYHLYASLLRKTVAYDAARARRCVDTFASQSCPAAFPTSDDCRLMFQGRLAVGDTCSLDVECGTERYCHKLAGTAEMGSCRARIAEGGDAPGLEKCVDGLTVVEGRCQRARALGEPCAAGSNSTYRCDPNEPLYCGAGGTCTQERGEGETCSSAEPCGSHQPLSCVTGRCVKWRNLSETCGADQGACMLDLTCDTSSGLCVAG
ncbi:MAG: hypothetical protein JNK82_15555 [Myxococcaceae bacterium]|nr:hypothetical protein [Myxococcaceae bacterium]